MASMGGNEGLRPGLPGGSDQSKKKKVMFETMASKAAIPGSAGGLESRLSVGSSPGSSFLNSSTTQTPTKSGKKKVKKGTTPDMARTFRFKLTLKDQKDPIAKNAFSQFNWLDMVAAEEQSRVKAKMEEIVRKKAELSGNRDPMRPLDPFASDDEDQIQALAEKFEAKYGSASERIKKKKRTRKVDDYADLGYGYDSEDPFIDNSEVHDELVPETVTTVHGGFYINSGLLEFKARESADEDSDLEAVIKAGEMEAKAVKRKRIKTKPSKDDDSSSDDPDERYRGTTDPQFGHTTAKKQKKNDISTPKGIHQDLLGSFGDTSSEIKARKRKSGSKPLGRPKMRNPDGTLVHPPKQKTPTSPSGSQPPKSISNLPKPPSSNSAHPSLHDIQNQEVRHLHNTNLSTPEYVSSGNTINTQIPVKKKKMNIKSINSDQSLKSITSPYNKAKKAQKVRPPGSIGLLPTSSIKLTNSSQGKTQVLNFSSSQGMITPTKVATITDEEGLQQQVQLKNVETSPNSMIKDLSHVKTAEERLKLLQEAVSDAMMSSLTVSRASQLQLPRSTTATKVTMDKQTSAQQKQQLKNVIPPNHQSKPKSSSSTSTLGSMLAPLKRSSSPQVTSGELKIGNDVIMTKASAMKASGSSSFIANSAKQSLEAVAEFAAAAQAVQTHPFDLAQYIEMFTKTPSTSVVSPQASKTSTSSSTSTITTSNTVAEVRGNNPSPNSKLIQSANKAVSKTKQAINVPDSGSNEHKRSSSTGCETLNLTKSTVTSALHQSASTSTASARPKSTTTSFVHGSESRNKSSQAKTPSGPGSKQANLDSTSFNDVYTQMQLALQRGDEKAYTQLITQLQASMVATSSSQSVSSPSTLSSKTSSNSNSPSGSSVILKSEKAKGTNGAQSNNAKKQANSSNNTTAAIPSIRKPSASNMVPNDLSVSALQSKGNPNTTNMASNLSIESLTKQSPINSLNKSQISNNRGEVAKPHTVSSATIAHSSHSRANESVAQKLLNSTSIKQGLLTTCTQQQKQPSSSSNVPCAGTSVLKPQTVQQQRVPHQYQAQHSSGNQQQIPQPQQPQKKAQQQKTVQIMNVSSTVSKGGTSTQQNPLQSTYYQISPTTAQSHNISGHAKTKPINDTNISAIVIPQTSNYVPKSSPVSQQSRISSSPKSTVQTATSFSYINQGNIVASSSNPTTMQSTMTTHVSAPRQISASPSSSISSCIGNISGVVTSIPSSSSETLGSPMTIQQPSKRLSDADTTQILSSLQPCQPPTKLQIGVSSYNTTLMPTNNTANTSISPQKMSRSPQNPPSNVSVTLPFSNQVSVTSPQFQANVIHVNQAPANQTNQNQPTFSTAKNLTRISVTQASIQRSQNLQNQTQLQQQLSSPATLTPVLTSPIQGYAKVSPSTYQHPQQISPNTRQVQQIISPSHGMSVTPIQQKTPTLGLTIQQAGSSTMTSVTPNANINAARKLSSASLPSTPAISITGISASSPMNVSLEAVNGGNTTNRYTTTGLQGNATITLPSAPAPMSFSSKNATYHQQTHAQQVNQQQHHSLNASNKTIMQSNTANNLNISGGSNVRQIQMQSMPHQQAQSNMTAMYNSSAVGQQYATYGGQQQQTISPQQGASQQQGATLITVSPSHHQTVQISSPQFQGLAQNSSSHVNIPIQQTSQGATVTLQQQQHSSRGDLQTPPPFSFSYSQLSK